MMIRGLARSASLLVRPAASARFTTAPSAVKVSTGIVGLPVDPEARTKLVTLYQQTLEDVEKLKLEIRQDIIAITKFRLSVVEKHQDPEKIEGEIRCGQIEELVEQARDELGLVQWLIENAQDKNLTKKAKELTMLTTGE
jgi:NADH dehydrogenase (ubiquinone) 1 alpha subcomplex subunit 5